VVIGTPAAAAAANTEEKRVSNPQSSPLFKKA